MTFTTPTVTHRVDDFRETVIEFEEKLKEIIDKAFDKIRDAVRQSLEEWDKERQIKATKQRGAESNTLSGSPEVRSSRSISHEVEVRRVDKVEGSVNRPRLANTDEGRKWSKEGRLGYAMKVFDESSEPKSSEPKLDVAAPQLFVESPEKVSLVKAFIPTFHDTNSMLANKKAVKVNSPQQLLNNDKVIVYKLHENEYGKTDGKFYDNFKNRINATQVFNFNFGTKCVKALNYELHQNVLGWCGEGEAWSEWFTEFGGPMHKRPVQELAFAIARFIEKRESFFNDYKFHGGTNLGCSAEGAFITTSYDYEAPLDKYGLIRHPKYGPLKEIHRAIKLCEHDLVSADPIITSLGSSQQAHEFSLENGNGVGCLANYDTKSAARVMFSNMHYKWPLWPINSLLDCRNAVFKTAKIGVQESQMRMLLIRVGMITPGTYNEDFTSLDDSSTLSTFGLLEHINVTRAGHDDGFRELMCNRYYMSSLLRRFKVMLYGGTRKAKKEKRNFLQNGIFEKGMKDVEIFSRTKSLDSFALKVVLELLSLANKFCCDEMKSTGHVFLADMVFHRETAILLIEYGMEETSYLLVAAYWQGINEPSSIATELVRLIETANAPIFAVNAEGRINGWNAKTAKLTGLPVDQAIEMALVYDLEYEESKETAAKLTRRIPKSLSVTAYNGSFNGNEALCSENIKFLQRGSTSLFQKTQTFIACFTVVLLASASLVRRKTDCAYSKLLVSRANRVFTLADKYRGAYSNGLKSYVWPFYCDYSGFQDDLLWDAAWLHKATKESRYLSYKVLSAALLPSSDVIRRRNRANAFCEYICVVDATDLLATSVRDYLLSTIQNPLKDSDALAPAHKEALEIIVKERSGGSLDTFSKVMGAHLRIASSVSSLCGEGDFLEKKESGDLSGIVDQLAEALTPYSFIFTWSASLAATLYLSQILTKVILQLVEESEEESTSFFREVPGVAICCICSRPSSHLEDKVSLWGRGIVMTPDKSTRVEKTIHHQGQYNRSRGKKGKVKKGKIHKRGV